MYSLGRLQLPSEYYGYFASMREKPCVKVYKFFYIYTVRVSNLKMFCDFADVEYKQLFQHDNNKLLSLLPALE